MKKVYYYLQIIPIIKSIDNWYEVILLYLFDKKETVIRTRDNTKFLIRHYLDALTIKEIYVEDEYKISKVKPSTVIDIGANIGTFSILTSRKYPRAKIYSFEPDPNTYKLLSANTALNGCTNVIAHNTAVDSKNSKRDFYSHSASGLSSFNKTRREMKKTTVKTLSLESIFKQHKITKCDLIKMDCEGAEYEIINSISKKLYQKIMKLAIEYHDSLTEHKHNELVEKLETNGYKVTSHKHPLEQDIGIIYATR